MIESKVCYFAEPGPANTRHTLNIANDRSDELAIGTILVASTTGATAIKAAKILHGKRVVAVSHHVGYSMPNILEWTESNVRKFEALGGIRLTASHAFHGVSKAARKKWNTCLSEELVKNTLRLFGEGMKVACEIAVMAADAGLAHTGEDVVSIAGTGSGADTAIVLQSVNLCDFFDLRIKELLCKPHF